MIIYIGNDKTQRKEMVGYVHTKIRVAEKFGRCSSVIRLDWMKKIEAVMKRQEEIIEEQEERIAIMSEGGWHNAEKDPPKETDCYIVRIDYGIGQMTTMREYVSSEGKWLMSISEKITHWMPLPKPPKDGE